MPQHNHKFLIVEGSSDKKFFKLLCKKADLYDVTVLEPRDWLPDAGNGKGNALNMLESRLRDLSQIQENSVKSILGIVVDADYLKNGSGHALTLKQIIHKIKQYGYDTSPYTESGGLCFNHNDGYYSLGVWIMPDNQSDGIFEDLLKGTIIENALFHHACQTVKEIPVELCKFNSASKITKAEVATFVAWQQTPDKGYSSLFDEMEKSPLIDRSHISLANLTHWLTHIYTQDTLP